MSKGLNVHTALRTPCIVEVGRPQLQYSMFDLFAMLNDCRGQGALESYSGATALRKEVQGRTA